MNPVRRKNSLKRFFVMFFSYLEKDFYDKGAVVKA